MLDLVSLRDLCEEAVAIEESARLPTFSLGPKLFDWNRDRALMGVVNLSVQSWYRESVCLNTEMAIRRGKILHAQGADLVDIGAESTLESADRVDADHQIASLVPVIRELADAGVPTSVETYEPKVVEACLKAGATTLNMTGCADEERLFEIARDHDASVVICFVQGDNVREVGDLELGNDPVEAMRSYFGRRLGIASGKGVEKIFIDPGLGFYYRNLQDSADRVKYQMRVFLESFRLKTLGFPVCHALPHAFEYFGEDVRSAEPFFAALATLGSVSLFRTHEIPKVKAVLDTMSVYQ